MTYVITYVRKPGQGPRTLTNYDMDEAQARKFCGLLGAHRVTLTSMDDDGMPTVVQRWEKGRAKRQQATSLPAPEPIVIEGEVTISEAMTDLRAAAEKVVAVTADQDAGEPVDASDSENDEVYSGYCVKCKQGREFHGHIETTANGRRMAKGNCPVCNTRMNRILSNIPHEEQESFDTPDDEPDLPTPEDVQAENAPMPVTDDETGDLLNEEEIAAALAEDGEQANVGDMAVAFSEAVAEDAEIAPAVAVVVAEEKPAKTPRKRASRAKGGKAKADPEPSGEPVPDSEIERVKAMEVRPCPECENPRVPIMNRAGLAIYTTHPDTKHDRDRCNMSLSVVAS